MSNSKKSLTPSWFRGVLGACEDLAEQYAEARKEVDQLNNRPTCASYDITKLSKFESRCETLDGAIAVVLGTLVTTHQIPADRYVSLRRRIMKIKAGAKTAESVTLLTAHYKNVIAAHATP